MLKEITEAAAAAAVGGMLWHLGRRIREAERRLGDLRILRRELEEQHGDLERGLAVTRTHLAAVIAGEAPPVDIVRRGAAFREIQAAPAAVLYEQKPDLFVLDVRTPAEFAQGHIPRAHLIPLDELEDRLAELPSRDSQILVTCAAGGRSTAACQTLAHAGFTRLLNLAGGMHAWTGPRSAEAAAPAPPAPATQGTTISHRGGTISDQQVIAAIRECYDPEIPLNVYDLGLIYGIDIDADAIAVTMTLTSEGCPSARTIPEDVRRKIVALGQANVKVDVVFSPPWHPARISPDGKTKLGLA